MTAAQPSGLTGRRADLAAAALEVVAEGGLRALTHRAVDARAGLPLGTCSAYLRTRDALLGALAEHVAVTLHEDVDALTGCLGDEYDPERTIAETTAMLQRWMQHPEMVRVRAELTLEAMRNPTLLTVFMPWRESLVDTVAATAQRAGIPDAHRRAAAVVSALEGVLTGALLQPEGRRATYLGETTATVLGALMSDAGDRPPR